ncbi:hypothetical protein D3C72_2372500 [compost metagenome]
MSSSASIFGSTAARKSRSAKSGKARESAVAVSRAVCGAIRCLSGSAMLVSVSHVALSKCVIRDTAPVAAI